MLLYLLTRLVPLAPTCIKEDPSTDNDELVRTTKEGAIITAKEGIAIIAITKGKKGSCKNQNRFVLGTSRFLERDD